jgi:hypothetical protein
MVVMKTPTAHQQDFTPTFERRLREHEAQAAQLRAEYGDVEAALSELIRASFDPAAFALAIAQDEHVLVLDDDPDPVHGLV